MVVNVGFQNPRLCSEIDGHFDMIKVSSILARSITKCQDINSFVNNRSEAHVLSLSRM